MTIDFQPAPPERQPLGGRPRIGRMLPILALLVAFAAYMRVSPASAELEGWSNDFEAATAQASANDRNLLVSFYMHGCPPCDAMDRTVLPNAKVRDAIADLVPVRVNIGQHHDLAERYGVSATPTYVILRPSGKPLATTTGYHSVDDFVEFIASAGQPEPTPPHSPKLLDESDLASP